MTVILQDQEWNVRYDQGVLRFTSARLEVPWNKDEFYALMYVQMIGRLPRSLKDASALRFFGKSY